LSCVIIIKLEIENQRFEKIGTYFSENDGRFIQRLAQGSTERRKKEGGLGMCSVQALESKVQ
jgi:hypothetical protein